MMRLSKKLLGLTLGGMFIVNAASACNVTVDSMPTVSYTIALCPQKSLYLYNQGIGYVDSAWITLGTQRQYGAETIQVHYKYPKEYIEQYNRWDPRQYYGPGTPEQLFAKAERILQVALNHNGINEDFDISEAPPEIAEQVKKESYSELREYYRELFKDVYNMANPYEQPANNQKTDDTAQNKLNNEEEDKRLAEASLTSFKLDKAAYDVKLTSILPVELLDDDYIFNAEEAIPKFSKEEKQLAKRIRKGVNAALAKYFGAGTLHDGCLVLQKMRLQAEKQNKQTEASAPTSKHYVCKLWIGRKKPAKGLLDLLTKTMGINDTFEEIYPAVVVYTIENGKPDTVWIKTKDEDKIRIEKIYKL